MDEDETDGRGFSGGIMDKSLKQARERMMLGGRGDNIPVGCKQASNLEET